MLISALNALTLSPALCAVLLKRGDHRRRGLLQRGMQRVLGAIDWLRDGYVAIVRRLVRLAVFGVVVVAVCGAAAYGVSRIAPQGFLPSEDQGAFFVAMRLPEGASLNRTADLVKQVEDIIRPIPGVQGVVSVVGLNFIDYVVSSNSAFFVVRLKPYEQRTDRTQSADAIIAQLRPRLAAIQGAVVFPFNIPTLSGFGAASGFNFLIQDRSGSMTIDELGESSRKFIAAARQRPGPARHARSPAQRPQPQRG